MPLNREVYFHAKFLISLSIIRARKTDSKDNLFVFNNKHILNVFNKKLVMQQIFINVVTKMGKVVLIRTKFLNLKRN